MNCTKTVKNLHGRVEEYYFWDDMYCPNCGAAGIWMENCHGGDYYVGEPHLCTTCNVSFTIQGPLDADDFDMIIINQLK